MRATVMHAAGDVRIEDVPDPTLMEPTDAILGVTRASICGSDLWPYASMAPSEGDKVFDRTVGWTAFPGRWPTASRSRSW